MGWDGCCCCCCFGTLTQKGPCVPVAINIKCHFGPYRARSYMFSVHDPSKMFSKQVLGTRAFRLRAL